MTYCAGNTGPIPHVRALMMLGCTVEESVAEQRWTVLSYSDGKRAFLSALLGCGPVPGSVGPSA